MAILVITLNRTNEPPMLTTQTYLQEKIATGSTAAQALDSLAAEFCIVLKKHDTKPLVILNYDQIESKDSPIVRECRALVLNSETFDVVSRSFTRFFNWGQFTDEMQSFDFSKFLAQEKADGSLISLFWFDGEWYANTRGSFGLDKLQFCEFTWRELVCQALGIQTLMDLDRYLDRSCTYICELCCLHNKIVRTYKTVQLYLLTIIRNQGSVELDWDFADGFVKGCTLKFTRPEVYQLHSIDEIIHYLQERSVNDKTFEGVVIRDRNNNRYKCKSSSYLALHKMRGDGDNLFNPKYQVEFILTGETEEVENYFPEIKESLAKHKLVIDTAYDDMTKIWEQVWQITDQKTFALAIVKKTLFSSLLFQLKKQLDLWRKDNKSFTFIDTQPPLKQMWRDSGDLILKQLFGK